MLFTCSHIFFEERRGSVLLALLYRYSTQVLYSVYPVLNHYPYHHITVHCATLLYITVYDVLYPSYVLYVQYDE
jgi:hypothetical protein